MTIDRFEGEYAVVETDGGMVDIHISQLPENAREGDVLILENDRYIIDKETTEARRLETAALMKRLLKK